MTEATTIKHRFLIENPKRKKTRRLGWHQKTDPRNAQHTVKAHLESIGKAAVLTAPLVTKLWARTLKPLNQGNLGSCHDDNTEVLTEDGWFLFTDLAGTERLASVDPITSKLIYEQPSRLVRLPFKGDLVVGRNEHTIDFRVTPDHKMVLRPWDEKERTLSKNYAFTDAKDIGWYCGLMSRVAWAGEPGEASDTYVVPGVVDHKHKPQREARKFPMGLWLQFLGIYLAEGTTLQQPNVYKIQLAASKEREKDYIRGLLAEMGIHALELSDRFTFENRQIHEEMTRLGLKGVYAPEKFVPSFVFKQNAHNIGLFLRGHFMGDGCTLRDGGRSHYTSSSVLADDLQRLVFLSGHESHISIREPRSSVMSDGREVIGHHPEHRISVCEKKGLSIERGNSISYEPYDGEVFCATMPTYHTLVTRRNRCILISGNCTGNAISGLLITEPNNKDGVADDIKVTEKLARDIYSKATVLDDIHGDWPPTDTGSTGLDALRAAKSLGLIAGYKHCTNGQEALQVLSHVGPIAIGTDWLAGMDTPKGKNKVLAITGKNEGGHEYEVLGIDVENNWVEMINSWGSSWGLKGRARIMIPDFLALIDKLGGDAVLILPPTK